MTGNDECGHDYQPVRVVFLPVDDGHSVCIQDGGCGGDKPLNVNHKIGDE
jgi:hypothetical protein